MLITDVTMPRMVATRPIEVTAMPRSRSKLETSISIVVSAVIGEASSIFSP